MGFASTPIGFNEPTLTTLSYLCYLLAFLLFSGYLIARSGRAAVVARSGVMLAGATPGGTVEVPVSSGGGRSGSGAAATLSRAASGLVLLAWLSLTAALIIRWVEAGHAPYVTLYEIVTLLVWGTTTVYLVLFEGVLRTRAAGAFIVLLIFGLQTYALWFIPADLKRAVPLVPALRSYWLVIHVSMAIISYSSFATAAGAGLTFLAKHYSKVRLGASLPSEAAIEEFMFRAVAVGFPFMTLVLITGAVWANEAWTKAWSWDPKEVWALVTWLTYAAYLHVRVQRGVRGVTMAWLSLIGFAVVLITFMGVNYLVQWFGLTSMHTYSIDNGAPPGLGVAGIGTVALLGGLLALALVYWLRPIFGRPKARKK